MKTLELLGVDVRLDKTPERSLTLENRDYPLSIGDKIGQRTKKTRRTFLDDMDSIAYGVEAWFEENSGYTRRVTEATVDIAQKLGVPENEIRRWVACRLNCSTEKNRVVKSLLERLQASSPADRG
jgi:hypothetical protein